MKKPSEVELLFEELEKGFGVKLTKSDKKAISKDLKVAERESKKMSRLVEARKRVKLAPKRKNIFISFAAIAAVCIISLSIILPIVFCGEGNNDSPPKQSTKLYYADDKIPETKTIDEIYAIENLFLFDSNQIIDMGEIIAEIAKDNENLVLSYILYQCLIYVETDDYVNAFYVDYRIRTYKKYLFGSISDYDSLKYSVFVGQTKISYDFGRAFALENSVYISFSYGNYDYFLSVSSFFGANLTLADVPPLIECLFKN